MTTVIVTTDDLDGVTDWLASSLTNGTIATLNIVPDHELRTLRPDLAPHQMTVVVPPTSNTITRT